MKKFGEGQQPFHAIIDIPEGDSQELTTVTDQLVNSLYGELFNLLKTHGINPTTTTSADLKQVARAVWSAVAAGNLYKDTGGSNVKNLTHTKAGNFLFKNTNANDDGFIIEFLNKTENTGAVTVNVFDVENNTNHFNNIPLVSQNGNEIQAKELAANSLVKAYFSKEINKFVLLAVQNTKTTDDNVYNIDGISLRNVALQSVDSIADIANITKTHGRKIYVASYHAGLGNGGGYFVYDSAKANINDGGIIINGWVRQDIKQIFVSYFGAKGDGVTNDSLAFQKAVTYCELNQIRALHIPNGNFLLNEPVNFYKGNVRLVGEGALSREDSWVGWAFNNNMYPADYASKAVNYPPNELMGCTIIVPKNSKAFVYTKSVTEPVYIGYLSFVAKENRTVGNTIAIDFRSEFGGPTWDFRVEHCHFSGFNKCINFQAENQYCVAFVDVSYNGFNQNDEIIYFGETSSDPTKWGITGSRNMTWGLTFTHNKCHDNSRIIRALIAKDMCRISQNNLEGSIPYADGTHPKYAIDLELYNCFVIFEGNHAEAISHDLLFATTYFRKPDGTRHEFKNSQTSLGGCTIEIRGNNYDGIDAQQYHAHTLEGMRVINVDNQPCYLHNCAVITDNSSNRLSFKNARMSRTEGSVIVYPLNGTENIAQLNKNNLIATNVGTTFTSDKTLLLGSPLGQRQVTRFTKGGGNVVNYFTQPVTNDAKYFGVSLLVNSSKEHGFFGGCTAFVTYNDGSGSHDTTVDAGAAYVLNKGWNIVTSYFPRNLIPSDAIITSLRLAFDRNEIQDAMIFVDIMATSFSIATDDYFIAPYYLSNIQTFVKQGTFEKAQMFLDSDGVLNVCKQAGTIGGALTATATGSAGNYKFNVQDATSAKQLCTGQYLSILGVTYRVVNIDGTTIYTDKPLSADLVGNAISFSAPLLSTVTLT